MPLLTIRVVHESAFAWNRKNYKRSGIVRKIVGKKQRKEEELVA